MEIAWQGRLLVQVVAHRTAEQEVLGSIPTESSTFFLMSCPASLRKKSQVSLIKSHYEAHL